MANNSLNNNQRTYILEDQLKSLNDKIAALKEIQNEYLKQEKKLKETQIQITCLNGQFNIIAENLETLNKDLKRLNKELKELEDEVKRIEKELEKLQDQKYKLEEEIAVLEQSIKSIEDNLKKYNVELEKFNSMLQDKHALEHKIVKEKENTEKELKVYSMFN
jgi:chromosome segregation ATPase